MRKGPEEATRECISETGAASQGLPLASKCGSAGRGAPIKPAATMKELVVHLGKVTGALASIAEVVGRYFGGWVLLSWAGRSIWPWNTQRNTQALRVLGLWSKAHPHSPLLRLMSCPETQVGSHQQLLSQWSPSASVSFEIPSTGKGTTSSTVRSGTRSHAEAMSV